MSQSQTFVSQDTVPNSASLRSTLLRPSSPAAPIGGIRRDQTPCLSHCSCCVTVLVQLCPFPLGAMIQLVPAVWFQSRRNFEHNSPGPVKPTAFWGRGKEGRDSVLPCHSPLCSERSWRQWRWYLAGCSHPPGCHHPLLHPCRKKRKKKQGWGWGEPLWV